MSCIIHIRSVYDLLPVEYQLCMTQFVVSRDRELTVTQSILSDKSVVDSGYTANEGPVRIQYKCLVPIYVFPEMKLLFPKQNYYVLSPSSYFLHSYICERFIYIHDPSAYSAAEKFMG